MKTRLTILLAILLAALLGAGVASAGISPQQAVAGINATRASIGVPALADDPHLNDACTAHLDYLATNGLLGGLDASSNPHSEDPAKPGYSQLGVLGAQSVLSLSDSTTSWGNGGPWENAPFHLAQLLVPQLDQTGWSSAHGAACMNTSHRRSDPLSAANKAFSYPADGAHAVPYAQKVCGEWPTSPSAAVGLGDCTLTGPNLIILADGPFVHTPDDKWFGFKIDSITLTPLADPGTEIETRPRTDPTTPSAVLVPVSPLKPNTAYRVSLRLWTNTRLLGDPNGQQVDVPYTFVFTTGTKTLTDDGGSGPPPGPPAPGGNPGPQVPISVLASFTHAQLDRHDTWHAKTSDAGRVTLSYRFSRRSAAALVLFRKSGSRYLVVGRLSLSAATSRTVALRALAHGKRLAAGTYKLQLVALADGASTSRLLVIG
jgi:hypothetical protein